MLEVETKPGPFVDVTTVDALRDSFATFFTVAGRGIVLTRLGDKIAAFDGTCTHAKFNLCTSRLVDGQDIECPMHAARFHGLTGAVTKGPATRALERFVVAIEKGTVKLRVDWAGPEQAG